VVSSSNVVSLLTDFGAAATLHLPRIVAARELDHPGPCGRTGRPEAGSAGARSVSVWMPISYRRRSVTNSSSASGSMSSVCLARIVRICCATAR
jgi:hypothetical protein